MSPHADGPAAAAPVPGTHPAIIRMLVAAIVVLATGTAILGVAIAIKLGGPEGAAFAAPIPTDASVTGGATPGGGTLTPAPTPSASASASPSALPSHVPVAVRTTPTPKAIAPSHSSSPKTTPTPAPAPTASPAVASTPAIDSVHSSRSGDRISLRVSTTAASDLKVSIGGGVVLTTTVGPSGSVRVTLEPTRAQLRQDASVTFTATSGASTATTTTTLGALTSNESGQDG
jgi:hypothetical protein